MVSASIVAVIVNMSTVPIVSRIIAIGANINSNIIPTRDPMRSL